MKLHIDLPRDRADDSGWITLLDDSGATLDSAACRGKADNERAITEGNPTRDPERPFGDTPTGTAVIKSITRFPLGDAGQYAKYGPAFLRLEATGGQMLLAAQNGREGIGIHGGLPRSNDGGLRSTHGCPRVANATILRLLELGVTVGTDVEIEEEA